MSDTITGKPIFPHTYNLYISGTSPITMTDNVYNNIIQTDNNNITINLPSSATMMDSSSIMFSSGGGVLTIVPYAGDNIEGLTSITVSASGSCILNLHKAVHTWNNIMSSGGGGSSPLPFNTQTVYVSMAGNDTTGTGSITNPYLTITHAMSTITDSLWEKRYVIEVGPGNFADNFSWKAWVYINASTTGTTRLTGNIDINDISWSVPGSHSDERSGAENITFAGTLVLNWTLQPSPFGKFYFWNCNMNNNLLATGENPINQIYIQGGQWFAGITYTGINVSLVGVAGFGGNITCNPSSTSAVLACTGGFLSGNLVLNSTGGTGITASLLEFVVTGTITLTGAGTNLSATNSSLPILNNITIAGGAVLTRLTDTYSINYVPTTPANWNGNPTSLQNALDRISSLLHTLNAGTPIP
jgi:hypothetical protein